jgi:hypothetical protein
MKKAFILKAVFLLVFITSHFCLKAQNLEEDTVKKDTTVASTTKPRTVFLEVGGPGLALTVNYDTRFGDQRDKWGYRVGIGYYNTGANSIFTVPLQVNYLYPFRRGGGGSSFLELGAGTTFIDSKGSTNGSSFQFDDDTGFFGTVTIGYRYQQDNGGINFRIEFTPTVSGYGFIPVGGISVGYTF